MKKLDFPALQKKWDEKLKKSGFDDIEDREQDRLKEWHSLWFKKYYNHTTADYYALAADFATNYIFPDKLDKYIWEKHAEGMSVRDISDYLLEYHNIVVKKTKISLRIKKYRGIMLKSTK